MKIVTAKYSIEEIRVRASIPDIKLKPMIMKELTHSLAKEIMKNGHLPTPVSKDGLYTYEISVGVSSIDEYRKIANMQRELKIFKKICASHQNLVDRELKEEDTNILLGKG